MIVQIFQNFEAENFHVADFYGVSFSYSTASCNVAIREHQHSPQNFSLKALHSSHKIQEPPEILA